MEKEGEKSVILLKSKIEFCFPLNISFVFGDSPSSLEYLF